MGNVLTATQVWAQWDAMLSAAYRVLGDRDQAAEAATEAVVQMLEKPPTGVENAEAWMVTIAKRRAVDRIRNDVRQRKAYERLTADTTSAPDVADEVCAHQEAVWLDGYARATLPAHVYTMLQHVADGRTIADAAALTGMSFKAAEGHLTRARKMMRTAHAKTLAALGALLAGLRKLLPAAAVTATATVALITAVLHGESPSAPPTYATEPTRPVSSAAPTNTARPTPTLKITPGRSTTSPAAALPSPVTTSTARTIDTPAVQVKTYTRDDGYTPNGPVDRIEHCLSTFDVQLPDIGCQ